jgi:hypothetical protein
MKGFRLYFILFVSISWVYGENNETNGSVAMAKPHAKGNEDILMSSSLIEDMLIFDYNLRMMHLDL